jgi:hypothetical protein
MKSLEYYNSKLNTFTLILTNHAKDNLIYYLGLDNLNENISILKNMKFHKRNILGINYEERRIIYRVYFNEIYDVILILTFDKVVVTLQFRKYHSNERIKV